MMMKPIKVKKRDGRIVTFNNDFIFNAVKCAYIEIYEEQLTEEVIDEVEDITDEVTDRIMELEVKEIDVETIQDIVVEVLYSYDSVVARAYSEYRKERALARDNTIDKDVMELLKGCSEYWKNENSNKNATLVTTQRDYLAGIVSTDISRRKLIPKDIIKAHDEGILHFHDMDYFAQESLTNCELINLEDMLQNGTVINKFMIEKPHRFLTAMTIATQIITQVTSSTYGGATITLAHLAPFVKDSYDIFYKKHVNRGLTEEQARQFAEEDLKKEIEDGVQTFNYQINSMSNCNGQAPFISVFMYLSEDKRYTKEVAMITEEFFKQRILGMKNEKGVYVTQAFPKLLYVLEPCNINKDGEYYWLTKLATECTAKRFVPDYISEKRMFEYKDNNCFPCMGCRSFLSPYHDKNGKPIFYSRFNMGVVSLNLVDVALTSNKDMDVFWKLLDERSELCHKALLCRYNKLKGTKSDVAPILWQHGALARLKKGETIDKLLVGGYASISLGYVGVYEMTKYMTGDSHTSENGKEFAIKVMQFLNDKLEQWKEQDDLGYALYGTPQESTTYKFAKQLRKKFGVIEGITDKDYITNSYHVNVTEEIDAFTKLKFEGEFQKLSLGGMISYIECDNLTQNLDAVMKVLECIYENTMYGELNIKSDYCMKCMYNGEMKIDDDMNWYCPNCGNRDTTEMNVTRRTCGYIGTNYWNKGRTQEIKERVIHLGDKEML